MSIKRILLDSKAYLRLANTFHPLLSEPFGKEGYTLYLIPEFQKEFDKNPRLANKFGWVNQSEYIENRKHRIRVTRLQREKIDLIFSYLAIEAALKLSSLAQEAVSFLKQEKVQVKTLEPNFCHAKAYIFESASQEAPEHYYILGSSNLTEAGIGFKSTHNAELNIIGQGTLRLRYFLQIATSTKPDIREFMLRVDLSFKPIVFIQ